MRFGFTALPGSGHLHPMIPGRACCKQGARGDVRHVSGLVGYLRKIGFDAPGQLRLFVEIASMGAIADLLDSFSRRHPLRS